MAEQRAILFDSQILTAVQTCGHKANLSFIKRLRLRGNETPEAIEKGDLSHKMFEKYYTLHKFAVPYEEAVKETIAFGREYYPTLDLDAAQAEWIIETFQQYVEYYRFDGLQVLDVERPFIFKVYEDEELVIYYAGKIDLVAKLPIVGVIPIDHKNRGRKNDEINLNNQMIGYSIAVNSSIVYVNEVGLQTSKKPEDKFRRQVLSYTQGMKELWLQNTIYWGKQLDFYLQTDTWPLQINPYVCKSCVFLPICQSDSLEMREHKMKTMFYENEKWDVTTELGINQDTEIGDRTT